MIAIDVHLDADAAATMARDVRACVTAAISPARARSTSRSARVG